MDRMKCQTHQTPRADTDRTRRLATEAERIAEADADLAAGRIVDQAAVDAWIDSLGSDHELPVPYAKN